MSRNYSALLDLEVLSTILPPNCSDGASWQCLGSRENTYVRSYFDYRGVRQVASFREGESNLLQVHRGGTPYGHLAQLSNTRFRATVTILAQKGCWCRVPSPHL